MPTAPIVYIGMSGGVDSSVAAALLKQQGYHVEGVFLHFWSDPEFEKEGKGNKCCSIEAQEDARRVANHLEIELHTFNVANEFKERVVDHYLKEYKTGRTPNPCVQCNQYIKFGLFLEKAQALGADFVATGHYAQKEILTGVGGDCTRVDYLLKRGKDHTKDQAYFLHTLTQRKLAKILFPVGEYEKTEIRTMAKKLNLPVATKKDSQSLCFIPWKDNSAFLEKYIDHTKGPILNEKGEKIGTHDGLAYYTIGQRKGIGLGGDGPYFVTKKDQAKNKLHVTSDINEINALLDNTEFTIEGLHWVGNDPPEIPMEVDVQVRTHQPPIKATLEFQPRELLLLGEEKSEEKKQQDLTRYDALKNTPFKIILEKPLRAITEGQSAVFAQNDIILGGGIISTVKRSTVPAKSKS